MKLIKLIVIFCLFIYSIQAFSKEFNKLQHKLANTELNRLLTRGDQNEKNNSKATDDQAKSIGSNGPLKANIFKGNKKNNGQQSSNNKDNQSLDDAGLGSKKGEGKGKQPGNNKKKNNLKAPDKNNKQNQLNKNKPKPKKGNKLDYIYAQPKKSFDDMDKKFYQIHRENYMDELQKKVYKNSNSEGLNDNFIPLRSAKGDKDADQFVSFLGHLRDASHRTAKILSEQDG